MNEATVTRTSVKRRTLLLSCASMAIATAALTPQKARARRRSTEPMPVSGVTFDRATPGIETITISNPTATIYWTANPRARTLIRPLALSTSCRRAPRRRLPRHGGRRHVYGAQPNPHAEFVGADQPERHDPVLSGRRQPGRQHLVLYAQRHRRRREGPVRCRRAVADVDQSDASTASGDRVRRPLYARHWRRRDRCIQNGGKINALAAGSYVALIAPRIEQGGDVRVNGSAAYVAADILTMTMNQGLFDISGRYRRRHRRS